MNRTVLILLFVVVLLFYLVMNADKVTKFIASFTGEQGSEEPAESEEPAQSETPTGDTPKQVDTPKDNGVKEVAFSTAVVQIANAYDNLSYSEASYFRGLSSGEMADYIFTKAKYSKPTAFVTSIGIKSPQQIVSMANNEVGKLSTLQKTWLLSQSTRGKIVYLLEKAGVEVRSILF